MQQMGEMLMARSDRAQHGGHKSCSSRSHAAAATAALSPPMMSKAQVVYYLCRCGKIEPPHMIEVPHSHHDGLRLRDVKHRLTILRGGGMPNMFSWSCKRMYKNTCIWQDVCDDDSLTPASGGEYILKGSEFFENNTQEKSSKSSNQDGIQRKFRGAEAWLKASSGPVSPKDYAPGSLQEKVPENCSSVGVQAVTHQMKHLGLELHNVKRQAPESSPGSSDECSSKRGNGGCSGSSHEESGMHDIKVCEVSRSHHSVEHGCSVATQTDGNSYGYGPPDYKSSTPPYERRNGGHHPEHIVPSSPAVKATKHDTGKLKRRFGKHQPQGKESSPKVKMKHGVASCAFLHILSYCGGVDTKTQGRAPTDIASSEYSFDGGVCRAEHKMVMSQNVSPQYSMELHKEHQLLPYQGMDNNRSGPLIPYSSEYFDVKETVTPLQSSPLQAAKSSKAVSSNLDEDVVLVFQEGATTKNVRDGGGGLLQGEIENEWLWSRCTSTGHDGVPSVQRVTAADLRPLQPWNKNLRLSKRRFFRHWWHGLFESIPAKALLTRTRTWPRDKQRSKISGRAFTKRFFVGKCRRSRTHSLGC